MHFPHFFFTKATSDGIKSFVHLLTTITATNLIGSFRTSQMLSQTLSTLNNFYLTHLLAPSSLSLASLLLLRFLWDEDDFLLEEDDFLLGGAGLFLPLGEGLSE